jgi:agmatine deiminase/N-carbamoylputrescine amidase
MKLALCQMSMGDRIQKNMEKSFALLREAAENKAELVLFPEIQLCPFFPQYEGREAKRYGMPVNHPFITKMQKMCRKYHIMAAPNIYLMEDGRYYDATLLINGNGHILTTQKMVHVAQAFRFYEQDYYTPSEDGFIVVETPYGKIGIVICFDRHYPESIRTEALMGADLILIPTANTKDEPMELFEWEIRTQAFQSGVAIAMCNRVGMEDKMNFSGESMLVAADGSVIKKADDSECILYADVDLSMIHQTRKEKQYMDLRRREFYL